MVTRAGGQFPVTHRPQLASQREARHRHAELIPDSLPQIDKPQAHYAMGGGDQSRFKLFGRLGALFVVQDRSLARCLARRQTH